MNHERETIAFENPKSTRSNRAGAFMRRAAGKLIDRYVSSKFANSEQNAEELAPELNPGMQIVVKGGDELLKTTVKAIKMAGIEDARIVALNGGNACDGAHTLNKGNDPTDGDRLSRLLKEGVAVPANTIEYTINDGEMEETDIATSYLSVGVTALAARVADSKWLRKFKYSIPGHENIHGATQMLDAAVVGAVALGRLPFQSFDIERDGEVTKMNDLIYNIGNRLAGRYDMKGDIFEQDDPMLSIYEAPRKRFITNLPGMLSSLKDGSFEPIRAKSDEITIKQSRGLQADGEYRKLAANTTLTVGIDEATYSTLVLPEELNNYL